jgi:hypothetical protein
MREINISEQVNSEASRDVSGKRLPESGVYIPNYRGVNQVLYRAGGDGVVAFGDALAANSRKELEEHQYVYDNLELTSAMVDVNEQMNRDSMRYIRENPTGRGYQQYISGQYKKYTDEAIGKASNTRVSQHLQIFAKKGLGDWSNKAFEKENILLTSYALTDNAQKKEIYLNQLRINPDNVESLMEQYSAVISTLSGVLPASEYAKYQKESLMEATYSYGMGLIDKNPYAAQRLLKGEAFVKGLSPEKYDYLLRHSATAIKSDERKRYRLEKLSLQMEKNSQTINYKYAVDAIEAGAYTHKMAAEEDVSELQRAQLHVLINKQEREEKEKEKEKLEVTTRVSEQIPLVGMSKRLQTEAYREMVRQQKETRGSPTIMDRARTAVTMNATEQIDDLVIDIEKLMNNGSGEEAVGAAFALNYLRDRNVNIVKGIGSQYKYFADEVERNVVFEGTEARNSKEVVEKARSAYLSPITEQQIKDNKAAYNQYIRMERAIINEITEDFRQGRFIGGYELPFLKSLHSSLERELRMDASRYIKEAFMSGARGDNVKESVKASLKRIYKLTDINGQKQYMKYSPEVMYPEYEGTHYIRNSYAEMVEKIVKSAWTHRESYTSTPVRLKEPLIKSYKDKKELFHKELAKNRVPEIEALIGDKWESREVYLEPVLHDPGRYHVYFLYEEGNYLSKRYLRMVYKNSHGQLVTDTSNTAIDFR